FTCKALQRTHRHLLVIPLEDVAVGIARVSASNRHIGWLSWPRGVVGNFPAASIAGRLKRTGDTRMGTEVNIGGSAFYPGTGLDLSCNGFPWPQLIAIANIPLRDPPLTAKLGQGRCGATTTAACVVENALKISH